ncbi:MAG: prefoldin subunit alpha [archaeon]|jgi:prefoldin alpha subunit|nr:prefoldin subunit alpha [archaeon]
MAEKKQIELKGQQVLQAYQAEQAKLEDLQRRMKGLQTLMVETAAAEQSLNEISKSGKNQKIMVALGGGIYVDATLESTKKVKVGLGDGVLMGETLEKSLKDLVARAKEIQKDIISVQKAESATMQNLRNIGSAIESARQKDAEAAKN